jgi:phenylalanyl-tRNA synthetase beta chain
LGYIGSLSADISEVMGVDNMILFELNFDEMQKHCSEKKEYKPISYHPPALRDISGVVPESLKIEEIVEFIKNNGGGLLKSAEAFDVYKGKGIPENKKSVSFHLIYQSDEKTLDTKTIDYQVETLINKLKETINWEERK